MVKSLDKRAKELNNKKEALASYQSLILDMANKKVVDKDNDNDSVSDSDNDEMGYGGKLPKKPNYMANGGNLTGEPVYKFKKDGRLVKQSDLKKLGKLTDEMIKQNLASGQMTLAGDSDKFPGLTWNNGNNYKPSTDKLAGYSQNYRDAWNKIQEKFPNATISDSAGATSRPAGSKTKVGTLTEHGFNRAFDLNPSNPENRKVMDWLNNTPEGNKVLVDHNLGTLDETLPQYKKYGNSFHIGSDHNLVAKAKARFQTKTTPNKTNVQVNSSSATEDNNTHDYVPKYTSLNPIDKTIDTPYGKANHTPPVGLDKINIGAGDRQRGILSPLALEQIAPELLTMATNKKQSVAQLTYQPDLKQTFDISYQLGRNENQSAFNQSAKIAEQTGNIDAISSLGAQLYKANEGYNMQEVQGNATQKLGVYGQNIDTLNDAKVKNLALIANQQAQQAQADFNTRKENLGAFASITGKDLQNKLENKTYNAYANLFKNYGFDKLGNVTFNPDNVVQRFNEGEAQQFGMMSAQQGLDKVMGTKTATTIDANGNVKKTTSIIKSADYSRLY